MSSSSISFFATAPRGLQDLLAAELEAIGLENVRPQRGGAAFEGRLEAAYRACLWSRLANRVLLPIGTFEAEDDEALYRGTAGIDWSDHLGCRHSLAVDFTGIKAAISHSRFAAQRVKDAVVDQLRTADGQRPSVDLRRPDLRINVHMQREAVTVAIDLAGDSLHKRGYRDTGVAAPLKENLAAAMLYRADWPALAQAGGGFVDPLCGSGTLLVEAAWMATDTAPGILRTHFGFQGWRGHDEALWKDLVDEALERQEAGMARLPAMAGYDHDRQAVRLALANCERAGLGGRIHVERRDLASAEPAGRGTGLVATNPPYGERIGEQHALTPLYLRLGETLKNRFGGWRAIVLNGAGCQIGLRPDRSWQFFNGPIECRLERFEVAEEVTDSPSSSAPDLINRLQKNDKQLRKWRRREGVTCYRLYDADIPEYALAIDVYETESDRWLHVQEYEPPATVDAGKAQARLRAALTAIPEATGVAPERMVFKVRRRQRGLDQYDRMGDQSRRLIVREGACRLEVNLTDYLDTGLFLDHRPVRQWLGESCRDQRVLNLFCYTGAATVHAALGGARTTTSVDLSKTYLAWLRRNLALNDCDDHRRHRTEHADARAWLRDCRQSYDVVFLDPPSFSNSKRMEDNLDIQRDHVELVEDAMRCVAPDGVLIFSTNLRAFRLDERLARRFEIEDRTRWSIPLDYARNSRIHHCWFIRHGA